MQLQFHENIYTIYSAQLQTVIGLTLTHTQVNASHFLRWLSLEIVGN